MNEGNLVPFVEGYDPRRNTAGKAKGTFSLARRIKKHLRDPNLADKILKLKPEWWMALEDKDLADAIILAMIVKATTGDPKAAEWVRKAGFGDKLDLTTDDKPIKPIMIYDLRQDDPSGTDGNDSQS